MPIKASYCPDQITFRFLQPQPFSNPLLSEAIGFLSYIYALYPNFMFPKHLNPFFLFSLALLLSSTFVKGQTITGQSGRAVTSAVPFLTITPDARSGAMGDVGVALSPDANANYWNPARLAFAKDRTGASLSYNPWLRNLVNDMFLAYLSGYHKLNDRQAFGLSLTYFNLGDIQFTTGPSSPGIEFQPREFAIQPTFSQKLSDNLSLGVGIKFVYSNLAGNDPINGLDVKPGATAAGDVALYYTKDLNLGGRDINLALGANISNLGPKLTYTTRENREFIPTNLRIGTGITYNVDAYNKFTLAVDLNKLMVPTPADSIIYGPGGTANTKSFLSGVFGSFSDAPDGFSEEMQEIGISAGLEYWYNNLFAVRGGYFHENRNKGNRKYFTLGAGIRYTKFGLDFAYLIPRQQNNPLAETLRFTAHFTFGQEADR